jgi:hypothetical protein
MKKKLYEAIYSFKIWAENSKEARRLVNKILVNSSCFNDKDFECGDFEEIKSTGLASDD